MYAQIQTFGRGRGRLPSLLIGGAGKAIRLHLVGKGLKTDRNIAVFQQTLHSESLQPINHVRSVSFKLFCIPHTPTPTPPLSASHFCFTAEAPRFYLHQTSQTISTAKSSSMVQSRRLAFPICTQCVGIPPRAMLQSVPPDMPCSFACVIVFSSVEYWLTYKHCQKQGRMPRKSNVSLRYGPLSGQLYVSADLQNPLLLFLCRAMAR